MAKRGMSTRLAASRSAPAATRGFTLVELLVVIALLTILFVLLFKPMAEGINWLRTSRASVAAQSNAQLALEDFSGTLSTALYARTYPDTPWLIDLYLPVTENGALAQPLRPDSYVTRYWTSPLRYYPHPTQPALAQADWPTAYSNPDLGTDWIYTGDGGVPGIQRLYTLVQLRKTHFQPFADFDSNGTIEANPNIPNWMDPWFYLDFPAERDYWINLSNSLMEKQKTDTAAYLQDPVGTPAMWPQTEELRAAGERYVVPGCSFRPVQINRERVAAGNGGADYRAKYADWYEDNTPNLGDRYIGPGYWPIAWLSDLGGQEKFDDPHIQIYRWSAADNDYSVLIFDSYPADPAANFYWDVTRPVHFTWDSKQGVVKCAVPWHNTFAGDGNAFGMGTTQFTLDRPFGSLVVAGSEQVRLLMPTGDWISYSSVEQLPMSPMRTDHVYTIDPITGTVAFAWAPPLGSTIEVQFAYRDNFYRDTSIANPNRQIRNDVVVISYKTQRLIDVTVTCAVGGARIKRPEVVVLHDRFEVGSKLR